MLRYAVQMLRSGDIFTLVTLIITPRIWRVWLWNMRLSSFWSRREIRFCLVSCMVVFGIKCLLEVKSVIYVYVHIAVYSLYSSVGGELPIDEVYIGFVFSVACYPHVIVIV